MKKWIRDLSVRGKILLIIGINIFFLLVVGVIAFIGLQKLDGIKNQIAVNGNAATTQLTADMMHDALRADVYKALLLDSGDVAGYEEVQADLKEHVDIFNTSIVELDKMEIDTVIKNQAIKVKAPLESYINTSSDIVKSVVENTVDYNTADGKKILEDYKTVFDNLAVEMEGLSGVIEETSSAEKVAGTEYADSIRLTLIVLISVVILLALLVSLFIVRIIVAPVVTTEQILAKLSQGEITETVNVEGKDETARMLNSLNSVVSNLSNVKEFVTEVGNGNFSTEISVFNNQGDIYESLNKMKNDLKHTAEEDKKRNWATEGMAKFGDILRSNSDGLATLSDNIISGLVKYLGANQGGLFIVNDNDANDKHLQLIACYAWNKKKFINMRVDEGEGLVGQAWQENDMLYITDVPSDFVKITSGLGDANPNCFLIVPLTVNDETFGVIEIASFKPFEEYQKDFVKKLAESIASTLATAKTNERTKILLEQSQQQTEEMRAQEEEMRQNMEEMQATQEEMERKEMEMSKMMEQMQQAEEEMKQNVEEMAATQEEMTKQNQVIAEAKAETDSVLHGINATMATIEFTPDGNVLTANDNFLHTMKCTLADIKGKHHSNFVPQEIKESSGYKSFWSDLASGKDKRGEFKRINAKGEVVWLNAIYNPIKNADGKVVKVIKFATDITEAKETSALSKAQTEILDTIAIISKTDLKGNITYVNDEFVKWAKYSREEVMGKNHRFLKSGDQDDQIFVDMWKTISSGKIFRGEIKNKAKDGSFYWVDAIVAPVLDENGKPKEYIAQRFVINDKKEQEEKMAKLLADLQNKKK